MIAQCSCQVNVFCFLQSSGNAILWILWTTRPICFYTHGLHCPRSRLFEGILDLAFPCAPSLFSHQLCSAGQSHHTKAAAAEGGGGRGGSQCGVCTAGTSGDVGSTMYLCSPYCFYTAPHTFICLSNRLWLILWSCMWKLSMLKCIDLNSLQH